MPVSMLVLSPWEKSVLLGLQDRQIQPVHAGLD